MLLISHIWCVFILYFFFFNDTATTEIYTLSLHDALPIFDLTLQLGETADGLAGWLEYDTDLFHAATVARQIAHYHNRSEEHTSELQSRQYLVCRLLLEKKKNYILSNPR